MEVDGDGSETEVNLAHFCLRMNAGMVFRIIFDAFKQAEETVIDLALCYGILVLVWYEFMALLLLPVRTPSSFR